MSLTIIVNDEAIEIPRDVEAAGGAAVEEYLKAQGIEPTDSAPPPLSLDIDEEEEDYVG